MKTSRSRAAHKAWETRRKNSRGKTAPTRALSIRQPWAELVMRGEKKIEYRTLPTKIRERVYIYASESRSRRDVEGEIAEDCGLDLEELDALPRGVLVGTVEVVGCRKIKKRDYEWDLARPKRAKRLVRPKNPAQPRWFLPF